MSDMRKYLIIVVSVICCISAKAQSANASINPAGYYSLNSKTTSKDGDTYGYFGTLKIKQVDSVRIFVDLYVCKGAPGYNSGTLQDTLLCKNGIAVHTTTEDNTCVITFNFNTAGGVEVDEKTKDTVSGCGFGHGVMANGFYKRIVSYGK
jgi:hypothetical protein